MIERILFTGGARSGKSTTAENRLINHPNVRYVATSAIDENDPEWLARVEGHRLRRPVEWTTVETTDLVGQIELADPDQPVLVDCLTVWLARRLDRLGCWRDDTAISQPETKDWMDLANQEIQDLAAAIRKCPGGLILVTNEVGSGVVPATISGRTFRDLLGACNAAVAAECDDVILVVAGCELTIKTAGKAQ